MSTNLMDGLRVHNARNTIQNFNSPEGNPRGYVFVGKTTRWGDGRDNNPPAPDNSVQERIDVHNHILSLNRISTQDAYHMIRHVKWNSGIVYDYYRHNINAERPSYSGATTLFDSNFYVINSKKDVYVCLNNNGNSPSLNEPKSTTGDPFFTSDGYQWLFIYHIPPVIMTNNTTPSYIPVLDSLIARRTIGEINTVIVDDPGSDYTDMPSGTPNRVRAYFTKILGDGKGGVAKVRMDGTFIKDVKVVRPGRGYTSATIDFSRDKVYKSLFDLDNEQNALDPEGNGDFRSTCVIAPVGGWRADNPSTLGGTTVGVFSNLLYDLADFITEIPFRQIGILQDPVLQHDDADTLSGTYSIKTLDATKGNYRVGEIIEQKVDGGIARGTVVSWDKGTDILRYYQDIEFHSDGGNLYRFGGTEQIIGQSTGKVDVADTTYSEIENSIHFFEGYASPEYLNNTGKILYLTNLPPIRRQENQTERISIMLVF